MYASGNVFDINALTKSAPRHVTQAIQVASTKTGVDFSYLMEKAAAESSFNPSAKAKKSSASGLFQFIESTWMDMINRHGDKYGINTNQSKNNLLALRNDPKVASFMAAEFAKDNQNFLEQTVDGEIGKTELYLAHFMGASGASGFLNAMKKEPMTVAADIFPKEARYNRSVFYDSKTGTPRTLQGVYDYFDRKFGGGTVAQTQTPTPDTMAHRTQPVADTRVAQADSLESLSFFTPHTDRLGHGLSSLSLLEKAIGDTGHDALDILTPSSYGRLSLTSAQLMLLSDWS